MSSSSDNAPSQHALAVARNLAIDAVAWEIFQAMSMAGVRPLLLKGPTIAKWLYEVGERTYVDVDLLVEPAKLPAASRVLDGLGFRSMTPPLFSERGASGEWIRDRDVAAVDLHIAITGLEYVAGPAWAALSKRAVPFPLLDGDVETLDEPSRLVQICLHALFKVPMEEQPLRDLAQAIEVCSRSDWAAASSLAIDLGVLNTLAKGLRSIAAGAELADQLGLPAGVEPMSIRLSREYGSPTANLVMHIREMRDMPWRGRLILVLRKMFPPVGYMREASPFGKRGGVYLILAYLSRPIWLTWTVLRSMPMFLGERGLLSRPVEPPDH